jgi:hypothetical protein
MIVLAWIRIRNERLPPTNDELPVLFYHSASPNDRREAPTLLMRNFAQRQTDHGAENDSMDLFDKVSCDCYVQKPDSRMINS